MVMGLSGSGKSTVIRCLNRLIPSTAGSIGVDGLDVVTADEAALRDIRRRKMSMVFQSFGLLPHRSVISNVAFGLELQGESKEERYSRARETIAQVGLEGYEDSMVSALSGGMQQRVGLARALCTGPDILLMDEAFSALDPLIRSNMQDELLELQAKLHKTIFFITHDLDEALKLADRIAIMKDGAIVQVDTPEGILTHPADDYVRSFVENVDRSKVITAGSIMKKPQLINVSKDGPKVACRAMSQHGSSHVMVVDSNRMFLGMVTIDDAVRLEKEGKESVLEILLTDVYVTSPDTPVADLMHTAFSAKYPIAVVDENGKLLGSLDRSTILTEVLEESSHADAAVQVGEQKEVARTLANLREGGKDK